MSKLPIPNRRSGAGSVSFVGLKSRTVKSAAYDTDINNMVKGLAPFSTSRKQPFYIDESNLPRDYETMFNQVVEAQDAFLALPPEIREAFNNNPALLVAAIDDPKQHDRLVSLGVLKESERPINKASEDTPPPEGGNSASG